MEGRSPTVTERLKLRLFLSDIPLGIRRRLRESGALEEACGDFTSLVVSLAMLGRSADETEALSLVVVATSNRFLPNPEINFVFFWIGRSMDEAGVAEAAGSASPLTWVPFFFSDFFFTFKPPKAMVKS